MAIQNTLLQNDERVSCKNHYENFNKIFLKAFQTHEKKDEKSFFSSIFFCVVEDEEEQEIIFFCSSYFLK
jgi:hypothetical protein